MNWDVYTLGGGAYLQMIFNGVAAFVGDGDYMLLLKMAMLIGILATIARSAYKGMLFDWQWFIGATMGFYVAFVPTATVIITDQLDPSQSSVVENVPLGLAASAGIADEVGWWLTQKFDQYFSLPNDLQYDQHGMLFGNALVDATMRAEITDSRTAGNLSEFFQQCVFYDLLLGKYALYDLQTAPDLWAFIQTNTSVARSFSYQPATGPATVEVCHDSANGDLNNDLQAAIPQTINVLGYQLVQADTRNNAIAAYTSTMPVAYQYFTGLADDATRVVMQATLANAMKRGISDWASRTDATAAAQNYSAAIAETQQRTSYTVMGELAQKYLPLLNNLLKAGIFAVFPIIFALALLPGGWRVILTYAKTLAWVELWSPLFAVIHLGMTLTTASHAKGAITLGDGTQVLSMVTYSGLGQVMSDYSILAAYLTVLIPALSWAIVAGGGAVLSSGIQSVLSSYQRAADRAAGEATKGDIGLGNTSFGNASWWAQNEAPTMSMGSSRYTDATGRTYTTTADGQYVQMPQSALPMSLGIENALRGSVEKGATEATRAARSDTAAASQRIGAQMTELDQLNRQLSSNAEFRDSVGKTQAADFQRSYQEMNSMLDQVRRGTSLSRSETAQLLFEGGASISGRFGAGVPGISPMQASAGISASAGGRYLSGDSADKRLALEHAKQLGLDTTFGTQLATTSRAGQDVAGTYSGGDMKAYADNLSSQLSRDSTLVTAANASIEHAKSFEEARTLVESDGFASRIQLDDTFRHWLTHQMGGNEAAALSLIQHGAQENDAAAQSTLLRYVQSFSREYAERIAESASVDGMGSVTLQGRDWVSAVRDSGERQAVALRASGDGKVRSGAAGDGLASSTIHGHVDAAREEGSAEREKLAKDVLNQQMHAGVDYFGKKLSDDKAMDRGAKESLTRQVVIGPLDDSDLKQDREKP